MKENQVMISNYSESFNLKAEYYIITMTSCFTVEDKRNDVTFVRNL